MTRVGKVCLPGLLVLAVAACSTPENKYYTLNAISGSPEVAASARGRTLSIDEIVIPAFLDRSQIVVRTDQNRTDIREYERWMEPLDDMIRRVLLADLSNLLGSDRVALSGSTSGDSVSVTITEFGEESQHAVLRGAWSIKASDTKTTRVVEHRFDFEAPIEGQDTASSVAALSTLLGRLSEDIASNP